MHEKSGNYRAKTTIWRMAGQALWGGVLRGRCLDGLFDPGLCCRFACCGGSRFRVLRVSDDSGCSIRASGCGDRQHLYGAVRDPLAAMSRLSLTFRPGGGVSARRRCFGRRRYFGRRRCLGRRRCFGPAAMGRWMGVGSPSLRVIRAGSLRPPPSGCGHWRRLRPAGHSGCSRPSRRGP